MNYEEKYNQALKRAKKVHDGELTISQDEVNNFNVYEYIFPELRESEDERIRKEIIDYIILYQDSLTKEEYNSWISWLEKQGEQKPEENKGNIGGISPNWSEEDEKFLNYAISLTDDAQIKNFLESLKDRVQPQPKQDWSEEDEKMKNLIISTLTSVGTINLERYYHMNFDEVENWLKSIKPQSHWKPSEEQMNAIKFCCANFEEYDALKSLYNDLKTLI